MITVQFRYLTGIPEPLFTNARLTGSFNDWVELPMQPLVADDGCPGFGADVQFEDARAGEQVRWGVRLDGPGGTDSWGICAEVSRANSVDRVREFTLPGAGRRHEERYYLTWGLRLGAQKVHRVGVSGPGLRFAVWAPNAAEVEVVFATAERPYITDDGDGIDPTMPTIALNRGPDGIWTGGPAGDFARFAGAPYLFRIGTTDGLVLYRTDPASRWQAGQGWINPADQPGTAHRRLLRAP